MTCRNGQWAKCTTDACLTKATCLKSHKQYNGIPLMRTMSMPTQSSTCQMVPFQGLPSGQLQGVSGNLEHWQGVTAGAALRIRQQACVLIARTGCQGVGFACVRITCQVRSSRATEHQMESSALASQVQVRGVARASNLLQWGIQRINSMPLLSHVTESTVPRKQCQRSSAMGQVQAGL